MLNLNGSPTELHRGGQHPNPFQRRDTDPRHGHIHHRVHRSHLVEGHLLHRHAVGIGLCLGQEAKDPESELLRDRTQVGFFQLTDQGRIVVMVVVFPLEPPPQLRSHS